MQARLKEVIKCLDEFVPSSYEPDTLGRLYEIFEGFSNLRDRAKAIPSIYALIERFPSSEFGTPGPLVHELEAIPGYDRQLIKSLGRQPTMLTIWMVNRILNTNLAPGKRTRWLGRLTAVKSHPKADELMREQAESVLRYQETGE